MGKIPFRLNWLDDKLHGIAQAGVARAGIIRARDDDDDRCSPLDPRLNHSRFCSRCYAQWSRNRVSSSLLAGCAGTTGGRGKKCALARRRPDLDAEKLAPGGKAWSRGGLENPASRESSLSPGNYFPREFCNVSRVARRHSDVSRIIRPVRGRCGKIARKYFAVFLFFFFFPFLSSIVNSRRQLDKRNKMSQFLERPRVVGFLYKSIIIVLIAERCFLRTILLICRMNQTFLPTNFFFLILPII